LRYVESSGVLDSYKHMYACESVCVCAHECVHMSEFVCVCVCVCVCSAHECDACVFLCYVRLIAHSDVCV
jgi:hypothetical protein